ncbi:MAG: glycosyltransferase family 4 protein [Planctomycetes bacterium]|nr:glycosyltransferase family 4 protein [Planctomycetota bacterium]
MNALAWLGRALLAPPGWLAGALSSRWRERSLFCFFATPGMGGAERVHAQIVGAVADLDPVVVFTEVARDASLLPLYEAHCNPLQLHGRARLRVREYFNEARMAAEINRARNPVVLGAFSHFFYRLLPRLRRDVRCVDLIHNFGVEFEHFSLPYVERIDARVVLSHRIKEEFASIYAAFGCPPGLSERIVVIPNGVQVPDAPADKVREGPLRVLYVGRSTPEKRVHLVTEVAAEVARRGIDAEFTLVGDIELADALGANCRLVGLVTDAATLRQHYEQAHFLLLTSSREGLPMAMLEAMAQGCVPLVPGVGAILEHVNPGLNGILLDPEPEIELVRQAADAIERLSKHRGALAAMGKAAHAHVHEHCSDTAFRAAWRKVLATSDD